MANVRVAVTTKLPPELVDRVDVLAETLGITRSECCYRLIRNGAADMETLVESPLGEGVRFMAELLGDPHMRKELKALRKRLEERHKQPDLPGLAAG